MLQQLQIRNVALIERLDLHFGAGLTTITGETGAGKSITFDALGLLLGDRAAQDLIRSGQDEASVLGVFELRGAASEGVAEILRSADVPPGPELIIRRTVSRKGANRVLVNDTPVTVGLLQRLADWVVERIGQHAQLSLVRPGSHRELVDAWGGYTDELVAMRSAHAAWKQARTALDELRSMASARAERIEFLRFQIREFEALKLREGEYDELERRVDRARNGEKLRQTAGGASKLLYDDERSVCTLLRNSLELLQRASVIDEALSPMRQRLEDLVVVAEDLGRDLSWWVGDLGEDEDIDALQARHEQIRKAMRRAGCDDAGLLTRFAEMKDELRRLEHYEDTLEQAERLERKTHDAARAQADRVEALREAAAARFFEQVIGILAHLSMPNTRLSWRRGSNSDLQPWGWGDGEIFFSANRGQELAPLRKTASGGELSRLMLAFKTTLVRTDPVETYVFDEVDTGIGGATAEILGRMLADLGQERQILCITHQPQVAAFGHAHLHASKRVVEERTVSVMQQLSPEERESEMARMLGGVQVSEATVAHAREMLSSAQSYAQAPA